MELVKVLLPESGGTIDVEIPIACRTPICFVKRAVLEATGIPCVQQRFDLANHSLNEDELVIPQALRLHKRARNATLPLLIKPFQGEDIVLSIDPKVRHIGLRPESMEDARVPSLVFLRFIPLHLEPAWH